MNRSVSLLVCVSVSLLVSNAVSLPYNVYFISLFFFPVSNPQLFDGPPSLV